MYIGNTLLLGAEFFGPPQPAQSYDAFQQQMSPLVPVGAALMLLNPIVGAAVLIGGVMSSTKAKPGSKRGTHGY